MEFELKAYLERIGLELDGSESETEKLKKIHLHHITHIPFEALDPYMDRPVGIDPASTFEKMVVNKRGGYCFEQNGLLCTALNAAGVKTYSVQARVGNQEGFGQPLHRMNVAEADGLRYIADVGYGGDCFVLPLELKLDVEQSDGRNTYRVVKHPTPECDYAVQILKEGKFTNLLGFVDKPAPEGDFEVCSFYTNFSPKSGFKLFLMCARPTLEGGKYTLFNKSASYTDPEGNVERFELEDDAALIAYFRDKLEINMDGVEFKYREFVMPQ